MSTEAPLPVTPAGGGAITLAMPDAAAARPGPAPAPAPAVEELRARAAAYGKQDKFHRSLKLPATDAHSELTVTYAVGGVQSDTAPTLLFIGGMYGGRYLITLLDYMAEQRGIRVVVTDRPGMGGSTKVAPSLRLSVWLETVPALMRALNAQHLSLASHSCGVMYALNTVYAMPWILPPSNRKLTLFAPWVSPDHTDATLMNISSHFPASMVGSFDSIVRFVNNAVMPTVRFSGVLSGAVSAPFTSQKDGERDQESLDKDERDDLCQKYCGVAAAEFAARSGFLSRAAMAEDTSGANHEALLCMRKDVAGPWGHCDNYETFPDALDAKLREHFRESQEGAAAGDAKPSFIVKAFWAESDIMIGKKGPQYFEKCFAKFRQRESADAEEEEEGSQDRCIRFESELVPDTNHETLCLPQFGVLHNILDDIVGPPFSGE